MSDHPNDKIPPGAARGEKAEVIRRKFCLEEDHVYESPYNDYEFTKYNMPAGYEEGYLCFEEEELDIAVHNGKVYYIKKIENV